MLRATPLLLLLACHGSDTTPPDETVLSVVSLYPADGASEIPLDASVRVTLDGVLDPALLTPENFGLNPPVDGVFRWDEPSLTATFDPVADLDPQATYVVRLTTGLGIEANLTTTFSTKAPAAPVLPDSTTTFDADMVTVSAEGDDLRTYTLTTTHPLRDNVPADKRRVFSETTDAPRLRSGAVLFDALFQQAIDDLRLASVSEINDGGFRNGAPTPCDCYETGESWTYVWTRDTSYATWLGLGWVDPVRAMNSLLFKLSPPKGGGPEQIVQDTGSGGSWPVSTDRVVWAMAARELERMLPEPERTTFRARALAAIQTTLEHDRARIWDASDGLYRGEQSFLDWREQTYPSWTATNVAPIAMSKALSTNAAHHALLATAAAWGAEAGLPQAAQWHAWADDLAHAMRVGFWPQGGDSLSTFVLSDFDPSPATQRDMLGDALAVLEDIVPAEAAAGIVASYPHTLYGPPVIWPQQPNTAIYHNRSIWPFVTAFSAMSAKKVGNEAVFNHEVHSLVRGAALNLSNMENMEFLTGRNWVDAGVESGPVVNSRRQLWSVGGYLGMVIRGVLGLEPQDDGLRVAPFITPDLHAEWFDGSDRVTLYDLSFRGRKLDVVVELPAPGAAGGSAYTVAEVLIDGAPLVGELLTADRILHGSELRVRLTDPGVASASTVTVVEDAGDYRRFWPPSSPSQPVLTRNGNALSINWTNPGDPGVLWEVWRDGVRIADSLPNPTWTDGGDLDGSSPCYAIAAVHSSTGLVSQHSPASCWWGRSSARVRDLDAWWMVSDTGTWSTLHGRTHLGDWGLPGDVATVPSFRPDWTGRHRVQVVYGNGAGPINTGVTCATKWLTVEDVATGQVVAEGMVALPQLGTWDAWAESTPVEADLDANRVYSLRLEDDWNMTHLAHFTDYTGGLGGGAGTYAMANLHAFRLLPLVGAARVATTPTVLLDGTDDLLAFDAGSRILPPTLGAPIETWDALAVSTDGNDLVAAQVSLAFETDFAPWMLYLQVDPAGAAAPADGMPYAIGAVSQAAKIPFTPDFVVATRAVAGTGPNAGPWSGLYRRDGASWTLVRRFEAGQDMFVAADRHTISFRLDLALIGNPSQLRAASHVLWGQPAEEWKDLWPAGHTPWAAGGGVSEIIDL